MSTPSINLPRILPVQPKLGIRRNQRCPCGSGRKAKHCCLPRLRAMAEMPPVVRTQAIVAGILGHWPTVEPPAPVPAAVQQRYDGLVAQQTTEVAVALQDGLDARLAASIQIADRPDSTTLTTAEPRCACPD